MPEALQAPNGHTVGRSCRRCSWKWRPPRAPETEPPPPGHHPTPPWYSIKRQLLGDENSSQGPEQGRGWWDSRPRVRTCSLAGNHYHGTRERGWMTQSSPEKTWGGPHPPLPSPGGMTLTSGGTESLGCFGTTCSPGVPRHGAEPP